MKWEGTLQGVRYGWIWAVSFLEEWGRHSQRKGPEVRVFGMAEDEQGVQGGWREVREGNGGGEKGQILDMKSEGRTKGIAGGLKGVCERRGVKEDPQVAE